MRRFFLILTFGFSILCSFCYAGEIGYVSDYFQITLRAGPGTDYKILAFLSSGERVEIINEQGDWYKVRLLNPKYKNKEGWVLSRFIIKRKPYKELADELIKKNARLKEEISQLEGKLSEVTESQRRLSQQLKDTAQAYQEVEQKYESLKKDCSNFLSLKQRYDMNVKELKKIKSKLNKVEKENEELKRSQAHRWFATGAFVLFSGIVLGFILGRQKKRRSIYYS